MVHASKSDDALLDAVRDAFGPPVDEQRMQRPPPSLRMGGRPPQQPSVGQQVVGSLIAANIGVYLLWKVPLPSVQHFMLRWFTTSALSLTQGVRGFVSNFTSNYSHSGLIHLGLNMLALNSFGRHLVDGRPSPVSPKLSPWEFFCMYTAAGALGSLASNAFAARNAIVIPGLGASGAIFGVAAFFMLSQPDATIRFMFVLDMSSPTALAALTGMNIGLCLWTVAAVRQPHRFTMPMVDGMAHLGGTAVGALWYYWAARREATRDGGRRLDSRSARWSSRGGNEV